MNVNGSFVSELDIIWRRYSPSTVHLQAACLHPEHTALLKGYASYRYSQPSGWWKDAI